jgi:hypothetical protein
MSITVVAIPLNAVPISTSDLQGATLPIAMATTDLTVKELRERALHDNHFFEGPSELFPRAVLVGVKGKDGVEDAKIAVADMLGIRTTDITAVKEKIFGGASSSAGSSSGVGSVSASRSATPRSRMPSRAYDVMGTRTEVPVSAGGARRSSGYGGYSRYGGSGGYGGSSATRYGGGGGGSSRYGGSSGYGASPRLSTPRSLGGSSRSPYPSSYPRSPYYGGQTRGAGAGAGAGAGTGADEITPALPRTPRRPPLRSQRKTITSDAPNSLLAGRIVNGVRVGRVDHEALEAGYADYGSKSDRRAAHTVLTPSLGGARTPLGKVTVTQVRPGGVRRW